MQVYIEHRNEAKYPEIDALYAPSKKYPEYLWDDISDKPNYVYDMVRECLRGYGLDSNNYNTKKWNPLGEIIKQGDCVVIKPNWVEEKNENKSAGLDCLVTHASIIRAIIDYVVIALKGTGKIIVGDSPMPNCKLDKLMDNANYNIVWESCEKRNIKLEIVDFREDITTGFGNSVKETSGESEVIVDLKDDSLFSDLEYNVGRYRNGIVDSTEMNTFYHNKGHHRYGVNKKVLESDVIINLPKPKTHRKAGYTAALKNYIGVCSRKTSIPHNVTGSIEEGGDTYFGPKIIFETENVLRDRENRYQATHQKLKGNLVKCVRIPFYIFRRITHKKYFGTGNWYKNDTIWRSILDINRIMIYSDINGVMCVEPQRKFLTIGDMIVSGEKNGPLAPSPKKMGIILCSEDPVAFDLAVIKLMGFKREFLPVLHKIPNIAKYKITSVEETDILISSNEEIIGRCNIMNMPVAINGHFIPPNGWDCLTYKNK
ncbi:MAG: DUF362 domain-containing protein [Bacilli bacterium]